MIDEILFQRGHIMTRIGDECDDYDSIIPEHYFKSVLGFEGEVVDSSGSEYEVVSLDEEENFVIRFTAYDNVFETDDGDEESFNELVVECTGAVIAEKYWNSSDLTDVLRIDTYNVVSVK